MPQAPSAASGAATSMPRAKLARRPPPVFAETRCRMQCRCLAHLPCLAPTLSQKVLASLPLRECPACRPPTPPPRLRTVARPRANGPLMRRAAWRALRAAAPVENVEHTLSNLTFFFFARAPEDGPGQRSRFLSKRAAPLHGHQRGCIAPLLPFTVCTVYTHSVHNPTLRTAARRSCARLLFYLSVAVPSCAPAQKSCRQEWCSTRLCAHFRCVVCSRRQGVCASCATL